MVQGNMGEFESHIGFSNLEENFLLNACVLLRCEHILATPDLGLLVRLC